MIFHLCFSISSFFQKYTQFFTAAIEEEKNVYWMGRKIGKQEKGDFFRTF
jgi:hypothetical protein